MLVGGKEGQDCVVGGGVSGEIGGDKGEIGGVSGE